MLNLTARYPGRIITTDPEYPLGKARNRVSPGDGTGTPWEEDIVRDITGWMQALVAEAGITVTGTPDRVGNSDVVRAINTVAERVASEKLAWNSLVRINGYQAWANSAPPDQQYGFGKNVGVIGVFNGTNITAFAPNPSGVTVSGIAIPSVVPTGQSSFAQSESAMIIIGHSGAANQTAWFSVNGGITWGYSTLPGTVAAVTEVLVSYNQYTGDFFIFRRGSSPNNVWIYRSTNNGTSWTLVSSTTLAHLNGFRSFSVAFAPGQIFFNTDRNTPDTTRRSTDNGATWSNAFAPASRHVNSVVEWEGSVFALGHNSASTIPYVAEWNGSSWTEIAQTFPNPSVISFTRFSTRVGPFVAALAIDTFGASSANQSFWLFSRDGCRTWRTVPYPVIGVQGSRYQSPSPGGIHVAVTSSADTMTLANAES